jgi:hypothetical protein
MRTLKGLLSLAGVVILTMSLGSAVGATPTTRPGVSAKHPMIVAASLRALATTQVIGSEYECSVTGGTPNVKLDCDDPFPNNEPQVAVNAGDPRNVIASSNDYGSCCDQYYTSLDRGGTWQTGNMSKESDAVTGSDPVTTFDVKHGTAIHTSLNYTFNDNGEACNGDLVASISRDGGLGWAQPVVVYAGVGCDLSPYQIFNDKEWVVTDNNPSSRFYGRSYATWSRFEFRDGSYQRSAIFEAHSSDGGFTWSTAQEISGANNALCTFQVAGPNGQCDEDQFSVPTVGPDGTVFVAFQNSQNAALWEAGDFGESQYLLVKSTDGGGSWSRPSFVVGLEDGSSDYPLNVNGRQTLTGYQIRVNSAGNIVAHPRTGQLFLVFSDNRDGVHDTAHPVTNAHVFLMRSFDQGKTWTGPTRVDPMSSDQWFPWVAVDPKDSKIGILYNVRRTSDRALHDVALSEAVVDDGDQSGAQQGNSDISFAKQTVNLKPSNLVDSRFFRAGVAGCERCTRFHGDYIGLSYGTDGAAHAVWTDQSEYVAGPTPASSGHVQFIYYSRK